MKGAIIGDIIGSTHEFKKLAPPNFKLFTRNSRYTDDTVLTVALADAILHGKNWRETIRKYYKAYPDRGYGSAFKRWAESNAQKGYNSYGNGSAMRVSPVGWAVHNLTDVYRIARRSAIATHSHAEGIKGAENIAGCIYMARMYRPKHVIKQYTCDMNIPATMQEARKINLENIYAHDACSCQNTVPLAIRAFLSSRNFTDTIRLSVRLGGDTDTLAAMSGGIAEAYYGGVPKNLWKEAMTRLEPEFIEVIDEFYEKYIGG